MALSGFLSRLFGGSKADDEDEEELEEEEVEEEEEEPEEDLGAALLELPQEHAIFHLWDYRKEHTGWMPPPLLQLTGPEENPKVLSSDVLPKEIGRLQTMVTNTANQRVAQSIPRNEDAPPPDLDAQPVLFMTADKLAAGSLGYPPGGA